MNILLPLMTLSVHIFLCTTCVAQDSSRQTSIPIPSKYFDKIAKQASSLSDKSDRKSGKLLRRLQRQEARLNRLISKFDSVNVKDFFAAGQQKYQETSDKFLNKASSLTGRAGGEYMPYFDSLKGSLSFLKSNSNLISAIKTDKLNSAFTNISEFQGKLQQADLIKEFVRERKQQLQDLLSHYTSLSKSIQKAMGKYNKEIYYYAAAIRDYKETFRDPDKLQRTALTLLNKVPAFGQFMKEHSELGGLFSIPGNYSSTDGLIGLQTKDQVRQLITTQLGGGSNVGQLFGQQLQAGQTQLNELKKKLTALGGGSGDIDMPEFKPSTQKTKSFLQRLEYGTNVQSTKSSYIFPSTTDIGLFIGYRIGDKGILGIGSSYKIGWGKDIKHIALSSQGISFRSFADVRLKKSFYVSGGFEYNYQKPFYEVRQLYVIEHWQRSGLLGISKIVSVKSKLFKKTKLQVLWDFLSYQQRPRTEPIKFRIGYNF